MAYACERQGPRPFGRGDNAGCRLCQRHASVSRKRHVKAMPVAMTIAPANA